MEEDFKRIVESGRESTSLEFKESGGWTALRQKIVRCVLAMANTRDGGDIIVGVQNDGTLSGVSSDHLVTYDEETMKDYVSNYTDPLIEIFEVEKPKYQEKNFVWIQVREFPEIPVICKRHGNDLREGAIYVRARGKRPGSVEVSDASRMRELIELATDKINESLRVRGWSHSADGEAEEEFVKQIEDLGV